MMRIWMLSTFYLCEVHNWPWPVCAAYGDAPYTPYCLAVRPPYNIDPAWFGLVKIWTSPVQIEAAKQDPRVIVCGGDFDPIPPEVITTFHRWLDPNVAYQCMGQVIAKLGQWEPCFLHEPNPR